MLLGGVMKEWLPENFTPPADKASEVARVAIKRGKSRRRKERIALSLCSFLFVTVMSFMAVRGLAPLSGPAPADVPSAPEVAVSGSPGVSGQIPPLAKGDKGGFSTVGSTKPSPALPFRKGEGPAEPPRASSADLSMEKVDHSVAISWEGKGTFAVYKCDSPKFDNCSIMQVVEGNSYLDKEENSGKIVYYRIEPLAKKG